MVWFASTLIEFNYQNAKSKKSSSAASQSSGNQEVNIIEFRTTDTKEVVRFVAVGLGVASGVQHEFCAH